MFTLYKNLLRALRHLAGIAAGTVPRVGGVKPQSHRNAADDQSDKNR